MARQVTRWQPDTCGCVIEYEWDDTEDEDRRTHKVVTHDHKGCPLHKHLTSSKTVRYNRVLGENRRKNFVHTAVLEHAKENHPELLTGEGDQAQLLDGAFIFQYDMNGVLGIRLPMHPGESKRDLQTILGKRHGAAKVKVM